ncbi:MAG: DUF6036 family nucleotidyltransferase [Egibacteraceae bacterium]
MHPLLDIVAALEAAEVRAVVVGGVAVVLHGHVRMTADLDLVLDLQRDNVLAALGVLQDQGLRPRLPVPPEQFAEPDIRKRWVRTQQLTVFSLHDPNDPRREVDLFAESPVPFDDLWRDSTLRRLGSTDVRIASIEHLLHMKRVVGRPKDLEDIAALEEIRAEGAGDA